MSKLQTTQGRYDGAMEMKRKLYLRIILLINYVMKENLWVYVECSSVKYAASRFSVRKKCHKKKEKKVSDTWMDWYLRSRSRQFFIQKFHADIMLTLHNPTKPLNIVSTNSFSWGSNFTSTTTWRTNDLRWLQLARINNSKTVHCSSFSFVKSK